MRKLIIRKGIECILNTDCKWTCLSKPFRKYYEQSLNNKTSVILKMIGPQDGDKLTNILHRCAKSIDAQQVVDTEPKTSKYDPNIQN